MKVFFVVGLLTFLGASCAQKFDPTTVLNTLTEGYDRRVRPNWRGPPVEVGVTMYIIRATDISTKDQSMKLDFYMRQSWTDPRLAFEAPPGINYVVLGPEASKMFWEPDTFSPDGYIKFPHDGNMFFRINRDGSILRSVRVMLKTGVNTDFRDFPLDRPVCTLSMESYGFTAKDIVYKWDKNNSSLGISEEVANYEFSVLGTKLITSMIQLSSGNYSRLAVELYLSRNNGYYLRHFYLPTIVSFFFICASFWFKPVVPVVRVLLLLVSFMTGNYLLSQMQDFLPPVNYATMLEKYIVFELVLTAVAMAEFATVVFLHRKGKKNSVYESDLDKKTLLDPEKQAVKKQEEEVDQTTKKSGSYLIRSTKYVMTIHQHRRSYQKMDVFFRFLYPIIIVIYNIWYWMAFP